MRRFLSRTLLGLAIGAFFVWLSARDWPMDKLSGALHVEAGHLLVGDAHLPTTSSAAPAVLSATPPSATVAASGDGWLLDLTWVLPYLLVLTLVHVLRVIRWKPLLDPIVELDLKTHNRIGAVGFMAMFLFPLRLGELVRPYLVKREAPGRTRMSEVLATVVVERVMDGLMVSLLLFLVLPWLPAEDLSAQNNLRLGGFAALAVFLGASLVLAGAVWQRQLTTRLIRATAGRLSPRIASKINDLLDAFLRGLRALPSARAFVAFTALTALYWGINGLGVYFMALAFYLPVDLLGAYAMMACVVVGMMIPNSPGNVGSFWYFLLVPLGLYGISTGSTQAIAFGLTVWFFQLVQQTAFGLWYVATGQVSFSRVLAATHETEDSLSAPDGEAAALGR